VASSCAGKDLVILFKSTAAKHLIWVLSPVLYFFAQTIQSNKKTDRTRWSNLQPGFGRCGKNTTMCMTNITKQN
jgi:hypothetical protein